MVPPILRTRSAMSSVAREDVGGLLVEHQVVVAEMRAADVPMEILGLEIERESVGQEPVERLGDGLDRFVVEIGRGIERGGGLGARLELGHFVVAHGVTSGLSDMDGGSRADHRLDQWNFLFRSRQRIPERERIRIRHIMEYLCARLVPETASVDEIRIRHMYANI